ncbi:hypothetical protein ACSZMU_14055 [Aeromonas caviae]|uniref:hypothetical protein n=1 Tax=Aeromonas caviae TaxID=648 RepID=UPI003EC78F34
MARTHSKKTEPVIPSVLPLEYCTPERAARLLGCEVEDIFHWAEIGSITMYAEFGGLEQEVHKPDGLIVEHISTIGELKAIRVERPTGTIIDGVKEIIITEQEFTRVYTPPAFLGMNSNGNNPIITNDYRYCSLSSNTNNEQGRIMVWPTGFWEVSGFRDHRICGKDFHYNLMSLTAEMAPECFMVLSGVAETDISWRYKVKREDLLKLNDHIYSGKLMATTLSKYEIDRSIDLRNSTTNLSSSEPTRITANQSKAIVDLLKTLGYTLDDLQGSTEALQQKIARNGHSTQLSSVTPKTLRAWLDRADAR